VNKHYQKVTIDLGFDGRQCTTGHDDQKTWLRPTISRSRIDVNRREFWDRTGADSEGFVFQDLPEPNRACLVGVYAVTLDHLLSLYGIICVIWYTRLLPKATGVRFR